MADQAHTTGQSEISDKLQPGMMVPATADSRLGQALVSFEQVMQFTTVEVVAWLQKTPVFTQAGPHGPAIEAAIMLNDLSGEVMLLKGHDTEWLTRFLPTYGACVRLSSRVMQLYYNAGVPLPTRIDTPTGAGVHAQDLSSEHGVATRIESPVVSTVGVRNISTPDTVATRIESAEVSALGVRGLSTPETGIPITASIESPAVSAAGVLHLSTPDAAVTRIESPIESAAGVRALSTPDTVATRIELPEVSALGVRDLSSPETGIAITTSIESPAVPAAGVLHLSTPDAVTRIESPTVSAAVVRALSTPDTGRYPSYLGSYPILTTVELSQ
ncbi:hypothetical protein L873DRAFT_766088 [Choiromyces venosus 120613-1]|uniref:Uncharacterized protein n=1 Tax=Choiromyces venosus 120613-1 TaxID=1336337 RepID=A0A3N4JQY3_9PEZI|nr:hypothetical protein L873DRAFT_766088 [Choiromyces venosus 120613-1]